MLIKKSRQYILNRITTNIIQRKTNAGLLNPVQVPLIQVLHLHFQNGQRYKQSLRHRAFLPTATTNQIRGPAKRLRIHIYNRIFIIVRDRMQDNPPRFTQHNSYLCDDD